MTSITDLPKTPFNFITDIDDNGDTTSITKEELIIMVQEKVRNMLALTLGRSFNLTDMPIIVTQEVSDFDLSRGILRFTSPSLTNASSDADIYFVVNQPFEQGYSSIFLNGVGIDIEGLSVLRGSRKFAYIKDAGVYVVLRRGGKYIYQIPLQKNAHYYSYANPYENILKNTVNNISDALNNGGYLYNQYLFNEDIPIEQGVIRESSMNTGETYNVPNIVTPTNIELSVSLFVDSSEFGTPYYVSNTQMYGNPESDATYSFLSDRFSESLIPPSFQLLEVYYD